MPISKPIATNSARLWTSLAICVASAGMSSAQSAQTSVANELAVTIAGGFDTDARDHGRPVALVAAGLGVPADVFREAFSHVRPAPAGEAPDPDQVRRNKDALLNALSQYGVTNDWLDKVSNYYRYDRHRGETWRHSAAKIVAILDRDVVTGFKILEPGSGYTSPSTITVPGHPEVVARVTLTFSRDLKKNGSISTLMIVP
jgi:hypothetical protein